MPPTQETTRARLRIEPCQLALDLQGELAGRRDDQSQRRGGLLELLGTIEQILGHGQTVSDGLARAGLGRHQKVAVDRILTKHGELNGGR
jgi:hypothetical protein